MALLDICFGGSQNGDIQLTQFQSRGNSGSLRDVVSDSNVANSIRVNRGNVGTVRDILESEKSLIRFSLSHEVSFTFQT